uniref:Uncharacterized protein n=1 Tax=Vitrella brassicaformis TaxID=1169539 RepID=A0A6U4H9C8_9ALVE|mmetsp:Transcript_47362/g.118285  ORF Transcript_47362/g.118285 Transcript_47362/m.118285 type:complete len:403 (+) Transcript_47362:200-1408(+)
MEIAIRDQLTRTQRAQPRTSRPSSAKSGCAGHCASEAIAVRSLMDGRICGSAYRSGASSTNKEELDYLRDHPEVCRPPQATRSSAKDDNPPRLPFTAPNDLGSGSCSGRPQQLRGNEIETTFDMEASDVAGLYIGKGGSTVTALRDRCGGRDVIDISIPHRNDNSTIIKVKDQPDAVAKCLRELEAIKKQYQGRLPSAGTPPRTATPTAPTPTPGRVSPPPLNGPPATTMNSRGAAAVIIDSAFLDKRHVALTERSMTPEGFQYLISCFGYKWPQYEITPNSTYVVSTRPDDMSTMAAQKALKNFHKGIEHMAKIHEAKLKSNRQQKGADIAIADKLKEMADDPEIAAVVFVAGDGDFVETLEKTQGQKPVFLVTSDGSYDKSMVPLVKKLHDLDAIFQPDF